MSSTCPFRCPACRGALDLVPSGAKCSKCQAEYGSVGPILDLRMKRDAWVAFDDDRETAERLWAMGPDVAIEKLVGAVFERGQDNWDERHLATRMRQVLGAVDRLSVDLDRWLSPALSGTKPVLDLGCGPGMLLAALARRGRHGLGIDVSLVWLVVAHRLIRENGGTPMLAAAVAEALPLEDAAIAHVLSLDVIEHVGDPVGYLSEINRVVAPGGCTFLATPNRFSLAAEPHVGVWGVGFVPRRYQKAYVRWRSGKAYDYVRLLSARELERLFQRHTEFRVDVRIPSIPEEEIAHFPWYRKRLATAYNQLLTTPARRLLKKCGAFFQVVGEKAPLPRTHSALH